MYVYGAVCTMYYYVGIIFVSINLLQYLISEGPGCPDTLLDVLDEAVAALQTRVVVQRRPDLTANLLKHKPERSIFCIPASQRHGEREF